MPDCHFCGGWEGHSSVACQEVHPPFVLSLDLSPLIKLWRHTFPCEIAEFEWYLVLTLQSILAPWDFKDKCWFELAEKEGSWVARNSLRGQAVRTVKQAWI